MFKYTIEQLATIVALPTITILLIWTIAIFHKNRKKWGPYDIPIVSVLVLSVLRNMTILSYLLVITLGDRAYFNLEYCSVIVWSFNSIHTFQASSLTTIAVIGLFSAKLHRKQQNLRQFLTATHIVYHLFCLTTLCACVGVAAILAQSDVDAFFENLYPSICKFMPFNLNIKFNVFILVLHIFLAVISFGSFLIICYNFQKTKRQQCFDYLKKSSSDLSDMSIRLNGDNSKGFYDTYTIHQRHQSTENNNYYDPGHPQAHLQNGFCGNRDIPWNSDLSNLSTTVSSTNSRRPCLGKALREKESSESNRTGLETIHPVLIVCYLFYHLPLIVLCIHPKLVHPWPVAAIALWLGLVQDLLIPIGLGIVDSRFCKWVSNVYRFSGKSVEEKLPHVGLDGKFRPFGSTSQPQSLEISNPDSNIRTFQAVEHRFPITNGSLYTSIDGRLPVIHNYRRNKDNKGFKQTENQSSNVALHSSYINRHDFSDNDAKIPSCSNCEADLCPSHSNLHHLSPRYINKQLNLLQFDHNLLLAKREAQDRISHSQESLNAITEMQNRHFFCRNSDFGLNNPIVKSSRNLVRLNKMRLSRSEDSLNDLQVRELSNIRRTSYHTPSQSVHLPPVQLKRNKIFTKAEVTVHNGYSSSDDECLTDINETVNSNANETFDSMSSKSCYSITTEANGDFEFFQNNDLLSSNMPSRDAFGSAASCDEFFVIDSVNNRPVMTSFKPACTSMDSSQTDLNKNLRITRSNSKRSLEKFQAFVEVERIDLQNNNTCLQRSSSYMTLDDKRKVQNRNLVFDSKFLDSSHQKIKSVEYLPNSNAIFIDDLDNYNHYYKERDNSVNGQKFVGSVPDLKKIFISEYI